MKPAAYAYTAFENTHMIQKLIIFIYLSDGPLR